MAASRQYIGSCISTKLGENVNISSFLNYYFLKLTALQIICQCIFILNVVNTLETAI